MDLVQKQAVAQELCFALTVVDGRFVAEPAGDSGNGTQLINVRGHAVPYAGGGPGARRFLILTFVDWSARSFLEVQAFDPRKAAMHDVTIDLPDDSDFRLLGPTGRRLYCENLCASASLDASERLEFG